MSFLSGSFAKSFVIVVVIVSLVVVTVVVPSLSSFQLASLPSSQGPVFRGKVISVDESLRDVPGRGEVRAQHIVVDLNGSQVTVDRSVGALDAAGTIMVSAGQQVLVSKAEGPDGDVYFIADHVRNIPIFALTAVFVLFVVVIGWIRGFLSLIGMLASFAVIVRFVIPGILSGHSPIVIALLGSFVIMLATLYLAHGVNGKSTVALLGTAISLTFTTAVASASIKLAELSGIAADDAFTLNILSQGKINGQGLLLAGIIIGALGVLEDMTVGQASGVYELRRANPTLKFRELYRRGMNVGRDHIASTVYTLVLAYAGASLPLLIILANQTEPLLDMMNREFLATEIVRTLIGSLGIVAAVPVTTLLAALTAQRSVQAVPLSPLVRAQRPMPEKEKSKAGAEVASR